MRDLASLFRAREHVAAYELRGLSPARRDSVFQEWHVQRRGNEHTHVDELRQWDWDTDRVECFLNRHFPTQPRGWRL